MLPPLVLYRRLLRAHRKFLPSEMRLLGDEYVKAEFRAHRSVDNPAHLVRLGGRTCALPQDPVLGALTIEKRVGGLLQIGFLTEWQLYAQKVEGDSWMGEKLEREKVEKLSGMSPTSDACVRPSDAVVADLLVHPDEQVAQLYELLQAIRNREGSEGGGTS